MPHMMPMLWVLIFYSSLILMLLMTNSIYFFYLPKINITKTNFLANKWNWLW